MDATVLFTNDYGEEGGRANECKKLYSRIRIINLDESAKRSLSNEVHNTDDPIVSYINSGVNRNEISIGDNNDEWQHMVIYVDILGFKDEDFVQYRGQINSGVIKKICEEGIAKGISLRRIYIWLYGLLIDGRYNGSNYEFAFVNVKESFFWLVKVLHFGLFKIICKIEVKKQSSVDLDEFFIDDLQRYYDEGIEYRKREEEWKLERKKYLEGIKLLSDKKEIDRLRHSVSLMKSRISGYFLPLINSLLEDKRMLNEKLDNLGDVTFNSARKKKVSELNMYDGSDKISEAKALDTTVDGDSEKLDWIQKERNKRMRRVQEPSAEEKEDKNLELVEISNQKSNSDDSITFNKRDRSLEFEPRRQPNLAEGTIDLQDAVKPVSEGIVLDEETQVDVETDASNFDDNNATERSEGDTEISNS